MSQPIYYKKISTSWNLSINPWVTSLTFGSSRSSLTMDQHRELLPFRLLQTSIYYCGVGITKLRANRSMFLEFGSTAHIKSTGLGSTLRKMSKFSPQQEAVLTTPSTVASSSENTKTEFNKNRWLIKTP